MSRLHLTRLTFIDSHQKKQQETAKNCQVQGNISIDIKIHMQKQ